MAQTNLDAMDVDELLELRAEVERALSERAQDLKRQIALLSDGEGKKRGRPPNGIGRGSALKGRAVAPKYRGPDGETWAGRGATPRWLAALIDEGHSAEDFLIGRGGKRKPATVKTKAAKKKVAKPARKPRRPKQTEPKVEPPASE